jgi:hypothetical protein
MRRALLICNVFLFLVPPLWAQNKRLWVVGTSGEMTEYDPVTLAAGPTVKLPEDAGKSPQNVSVNHLGQILFAPAAALPLSESDATATRRVWFWNGHAASTFDQGVILRSSAEGSNEVITEIAPVPFLSSDGNHLFWFANRARRLQREEIDLSVATTWQAWKTDLNGSGREELASVAFPECRCSTGACEETCSNGEVWVPEDGVAQFFLMTQVVEGQTQPEYKASSLYEEEGGKWSAKPLASPLLRILDAASKGRLIVDAIPDSGCCGWSNESDDQTLLVSDGKKVTLYDEWQTYQNSDYDVSFYTADAKLSPDLARVAVTIVSTAKPNQPVQLADEGQADLEESRRIRKALTELPAVEVKNMESPAKRIAYLPHASLVGWINDKEILILENHLLVVYSAANGARRKSNIHADDVANVFLR